MSSLMADDKNSPPESPPLMAAPVKAYAVERRLAQNEAGFRLLFMNNPQPMWVFDAETKFFLEVNNAAVEHYGYSREEFLGMRITDIRPPEDVPRLLADTQKAFGGLRHAGVWRHVLKSGRVIDVEIASDHLTFSGQQAVLVVSRDITERKRAIEALQQAEQKYRRMFEEAIVGIYQSAPSGIFLSANPALAQMLGYASPEELIESIRDIKQQLYVDPARFDEFQRLMEEEGIAHHFECEVYRKDGSKTWISANVRAFREGGSIVRCEGTTEDIGERKLLEGQLHQSQKMEAVGLLAGGVAHDFNNALSVIAGYSDLLQMRLPVGDPLCRYTEEIAKGAHRAAALTRQLLAFSRKQVIQPVILDLNALIVETEKMLRRLIGENIDIVITGDSSPARIKADPTQMEQILMNLAVNARDAMPQGGRLLIKTTTDDLDKTYSRHHANFKPGRYVTLSFSDTGSGMDKATQARIFEPFFTTKEPGKGTGLGLSTVYGIVKQNDGHIGVYSEPGRGSTFKIHLPQAEGKALSSKNLEIVEILPRGSETILLVEDEEALRTLAQNCLESHGYHVLEAADGKTAMTKAAEHIGPIQLLLTDVIMPGMNGRDLANSMTALHPETRVVYMSGYSNDLIAQYGVLDAETLLLEKPFTLRALLMRVHQALRTHAKAAAAGGLG
jgi:two-component system cell cycle sensor histidine kinase/response regulator CckA